MEHAELGKRLLRRDGGSFGGLDDEQEVRAWTHHPTPQEWTVRAARLEPYEVWSMIRTEKHAASYFDSDGCVEEASHLLVISSSCSQFTAPDTCWARLATILTPGY